MRAFLTRMGRRLAKLQRRSEASSLTWGDVQRWDDGSGRITVVRSKTDVEAQGAVVAITSVAMGALDAFRSPGG